MADGVLCMNECIGVCIREGKPWVLCKLDPEKAYDHGNWEFLLYVMKRCGFEVRWREWTWKCFSLALLSVLINGIPKGHLGCSRGLR